MRTKVERKMASTLTTTLRSLKGKGRSGGVREDAQIDHDPAAVDDRVKDDEAHAAGEVADPVGGFVGKGTLLVVFSYDGRWSRRFAGWRSRGFPDSVPQRTDGT
jgi:hypothetical protein